MGTASRLRQTLIFVRELAPVVDFLGPSGIGLDILSQSTRTVLLGGGEHGGVVGLREVESAAELCKGYSPMLCFEIGEFDEKLPKLIRLGGMLDGPVRREAEGTFAVLRGPEGIVVGLSEAMSRG